MTVSMHTILLEHHMHLCGWCPRGLSYPKSTLKQLRQRRSGLQSLNVYYLVLSRLNVSNPVLNHDLSALSPCLSLRCAVPKIHTHVWQSEERQPVTEQGHNTKGGTFFCHFTFQGGNNWHIEGWLLLDYEPEMQMQIGRKNMWGGAVKCIGDKKTTWRMVSVIQASGVQVSGSGDICGKLVRIWVMRPTVSLEGYLGEIKIRGLVLHFKCSQSLRTIRLPTQTSNNQPLTKRVLTQMWQLFSASHCH